MSDVHLVSLHPRTFSQLFDVLKDSITDTPIHFHPDSIKIRAMDSSKTSMTYAHIFGLSPESYTCKTSVDVGVHVPKMWNVLKIAAAEDILKLDFNQRDSVLNIEVIDSKTGVEKFKTGYITQDCEDEALPIPDDLDMSSCILMGSGVFYSNLKTLESMDAEYVKLRQCQSPTGGYRLQLIGIGSPCHRNPVINIDENPNNANVVATPVKKLPMKKGTKRPADVVKEPVVEIEMTFPLKRLVQFAKAQILDDNVSIYLDKRTRRFLILQYNIKTLGELQFLIMSVNDEEDDDDEDADDEDGAKERKRGQKRDKEDIVDDDE